MPDFQNVHSTQSHIECVVSCINKQLDLLTHERKSGKKSMQQLLIFLFAFARHQSILNDKCRPLFAQLREGHDGMTSTSHVNDDGRRKVVLSSLNAFGAGLGVFGLVDSARAEQESIVSQEGGETPTVPTTFYFSGVVELPKPSSSGDDVVLSKDAALYLTCRQDKPDNVPAAILNGTRGKAPPVLSARFENPKFPFEFNLTSENLTLEGAQYEWFKSGDLIISARYDQDGVAATRSPDDLVGRGLLTKSQQLSDNSISKIELQGRGAFGKFATGGKGK